jgi:hypothetical protein
MWSEPQDHIRFAFKRGNATCVSKLLLLPARKQTSIGPALFASISLLCPVAGAERIRGGAASMIAARVSGRN